MTLTRSYTRVKADGEAEPKCEGHTRFLKKISRKMCAEINAKRDLGYEKFEGFLRLKAKLSFGWH